MPRRYAKRSKRVAREDSPVAIASPVLEDPQDAASSSSSTANTTGLLALPVELFTRIHDELLAGSRLITREDVLRNAPYIEEEDIQYRADILRPLTQTCRVLRSVYLPRVYEQMEAWIVRGGKKQWYKYLGERLEKISKRCMKEKELAKLVQVVTVSLTRYSTDTILPAFAKCLAHLPNLHTLRICHAHSQMTTALKDAFDGKQYPQIRTIIIPSCAHNIIRACPNVVDVTCNEDDGSKLLTAISKECRAVEVLDGFGFWSEPMIKRLPKSVPKLRKLTLGQMAKVELFGKLPNLAELCLNCPVDSLHPEQVEADLKAAIDGGFQWIIDKGLALLRKSDLKTPKTLTVTFLVRDFDNCISWQTRYKYAHTATFTV